MDANKKFTGVVNGKTYTDIAEYNQAFLEALGQNGAVTAHIELAPADDEQEQYDHCLPDFDLDELTGVTETDDKVIDDFIKHELSADRIKEILDRAGKMNASDRSELDADVKDMIESISVDIKDNDHAYAALTKNKASNDQEINKLSRDINQLRAKLDTLNETKNRIQTQIHITEGANRILRTSLGFYKTLYNCRGHLYKGQPAEEPGIKTAGRTVDPGNPGFVLDHDQKEIARKLFKEILGI